MELETSFYCTPEGGMSNYLFGLKCEELFDEKCMPLGIRTAKTAVKCPWDREVIAESQIVRVQIKSTRRIVRQHRSGKRVRFRYTVPGIRSKTNKTPYADSGVDFLAIYIEPQNRWFILPAEQAKGKRINISQNPQGRMARALERWDYFKAPCLSSSFSASYP